MIYDLQKTDDPRDLVHRCVQALVEGEVIGLPSETVYGVVASSLNEEATERLAGMVSRAGGQVREFSSVRETLGTGELALNGEDVGRVSLCVRSVDAVGDFLVPRTTLARRLTERCFPGPLTLLADCDLVNSGVGMLPAGVAEVLKRFADWRFAGENDQGLCPIAFRISGHRLLSHIHRYLSAPLVWGEFPVRAAVSAESVSGDGISGDGILGDGDSSGLDSGQTHSIVGEGTITTAAQLSDRLSMLGYSDQVSILLDDGPTRYGVQGTIVRLSDNRWQIIREGAIQRAAMNQFVKPVIAIVCTGNTCRSPMAETLLRDLLHRRYGREDVARVVSAGLAASPGGGATPQSVEVMGRLGLDLTGHCSQPLDDPLMSMADLVLTMTRRHRDAILAAWPDRKDRVFTLRRDGGDISDPVGMPVDVYEKCAVQIRGELEKWLDALDCDFFPKLANHQTFNGNNASAGAAETANDE